MEILKEIRRIAGINQLALSKMLSIHPVSYRSIESDRTTLSKNLAEKVAYETGCGWWRIVDTENIKIDTDALKFEGISIPIKDSILVGRLTLTAGRTSNPFTKEHFERHRKKIEVIESNQLKISDLESVLDELYFEAADCGCLPSFLYDVKEAVNELARKHQLKNQQSTNDFVGALAESIAAKGGDKAMLEALKNIPKMLHKNE